MCVSSLDGWEGGLTCGGALLVISPSSVACEVADSARARFAEVSAVVVPCDVVVSGVVFYG